MEEKARLYKSGFTLIELLVVISIIGVLSTIAMISLSGARAKARDARRLSDMEQIRNALELYKLDHGEYPEENSSGGDWEISHEDGGAFIEALKAGGYFPNGTPLDPVNSNGKYFYYYVYPAGYSGCPAASGDYYVLGIADMEAGEKGSYHSSGWKCPSRNWQNEFDWVTGGFEKG